MKDTIKGRIEQITVTSIDFPHNKIHAQWCTASVNIYELLITDSDITTIEPNAFATDAFSKLAGLSLIAMPVETLSNGIFNGLTNLRLIYIRGFNLKTIDNDLFAPTPKLSYFDVCASIVP